MNESRLECRAYDGQKNGYINDHPMGTVHKSMSKTVKIMGSHRIGRIPGNFMRYANKYQLARMYIHR